MEYLDHSFFIIKDHTYGFYICEKCKIQVYYQNSVDGMYGLIDNIWKKLDIGCNEVIIKNIIE